MNIALIGYGKMGKAIEEIALAKDHQVVLKIDEDNLQDFTRENISEADVAIEFTHPASAFRNLEKCFEFGIPVVCGTTGWLEKLQEAKQICTSKNGCFLYASNFSIGVNIFFELNRKLAELMRNHSEYDVQLLEVHHTQKKDAPSGTAITLAEQVLSTIKRKTRWVNRPSSNTSDLVILSERKDPAPGTHKVSYSSEVDDIEIIHTAHSRKGFAGGAVLAAEFVAGKEGIYSMKDVLGF